MISGKPIIPNCGEEAAMDGAYSCTDERRSSPTYDSSVAFRQNPLGPDGVFLKGKVILHVEDDPIVRRTVRRALEEAGATVYSAATGIAALKWIKTTCFDAALVDLSLPDMSGIDLILKMVRRGVRIPVLSVSGTAKSVHSFLMRDLGVYFPCEKPLDTNELIENVEQAITSGSRIHDRESSGAVTIAQLKQAVEEVLQKLGEMSPEEQAQVIQGRFVLASRTPDRKKVSAFVRFLRHHLTQKAVEDVGVGVAVRVMEKFY